MRSSKFNLVLLTLITFSGCTNIHSSTIGTAAAKSAANTNAVNSGGLQAASINQTSLQGNWIATCYQDRLTHSYQSTRLNFQNAVLTRDTIIYQDSGCTFPESEEVRVSNFTILVDSVGTGLNEQLQTVQYKPLATAVSTEWSKSSRCGIMNWSINTSETITTPSVCSDISSLTHFEVQLFGTTAQELYLDDCVTDTNGCEVRFVQD
jgi:hypothetical protein